MKAVKAIFKGIGFYLLAVVLMFIVGLGWGMGLAQLFGEAKGIELAWTAKLLVTILILVYSYFFLKKQGSRRRSDVLLAVLSAIVSLLAGVILGLIPLAVLVGRKGAEKK